MPGPTAWQQIVPQVVTGAQVITTTAETVVATLLGVNSRGAGYPIYLTGQAVFVINAGTTQTFLRIRQGNLSGAIVGGQVSAAGGTAGGITQASGVVGGVFTPAQEVSGATFVLTVQATGAAANWDVTYAALTMLQ